MKYKGSKEINKPRDVVTKFFVDPAYLGEYQDGFVKKEMIRGEAGKEGAVSQMFYESGGRDMLLTETITSNKLPHSFEAFYSHKHMDNIRKCQFTVLDRNRTRYQYEYVRME
ncbi:MAG: SRPBCC family protein [Bacteroidota bacterium]